MENPSQVFKLSPQQILMIEVMEVLRSGELPAQEIIRKLPFPATAEGVRTALTRAKKAGAVTDEGENWKLVSR